MPAKDLPNYIQLHRSGELQDRARDAVASLANCRACPCGCEVNRLIDETKNCRTGRYARVSSWAPHFGEEDCLRGNGGSGTIFFTQCNLHCVFCQNYDISHSQVGTEAEPEILARMMIELQLLGCHNINFVTPSHVVPQILESLVLAIGDGLRLPLVFNTGAYDSVETLRSLDGVVDIYMPDFKCWEKDTASRLLNHADYPDVARTAIREMHRQVGDLVLNDQGIAKSGLLVRHLVMPNQGEQTKEILNFLADELSPDTFVNIMDQYRPAGAVDQDRFADLARCPTTEEVREAYLSAREFGLCRFDADPGW